MILDLTTYEGRQAFENSKIWKNIRDIKLAQDPLCEEDLKKGLFVPATEVHHKTDIAKCPTFENATNIDGLASLCHKCHSIITAKNQGFGKKFTAIPYNSKEYKF